eukprot:1497848-Amphidinium_carterae.1
MTLGMSLNRLTPIAFAHVPNIICGPWNPPFHTVVTEIITSKLPIDNAMVKYNGNNRTLLQLQLSNCGN